MMEIVPLTAWTGWMMNKTLQVKKEVQSARKGQCKQNLVNIPTRVIKMRTKEEVVRERIQNTTKTNWREAISRKAIPSSHLPTIARVVPIKEVKRL